MSNLYQSICSKVEYIYREYEFLTCVCVMDVWERRMVNLTLFSIAVATTYSTIHYLPHYSAQLATYMGIL